jgi:hypothetical protein
MADNRLWCRECENHVSPDYPHSCYNAKQVRAVRDAEAAVIAAAEAMLAAQQQLDHADATIEDASELQREWDKFGADYEKAEGAVLLATEALHAARGQIPQDAEGITRQGDASC